MTTPFPPAASDQELSTSTTMKRAVVSYLLLAGVLTILGALGNAIFFDGALGDAEADLVEWIAEHRIAVLDAFFTVGSALSDTWTIIGVVVGAASMLWVTGHGRHAATVGMGIALELAGLFTVSQIIDRPRPDVEALHSVPSTPSFPSGHVAAAFVIYGLLSLIARSINIRSHSRWVWAVPIVFSLVVACSRVYEGVHYPTDVVAGLMLGVGALWLAAYSTGAVDIFFSTEREPTDDDG